MQPSDLAFVRVPSDPRLSPDGAWVAFTVTTPDLEANTYRSQIWLGRADGSSPAVPVTAGAGRDARPRWSPDGIRMAFTSHRGEQGAQVLVIAVGYGVGEAHVVASSAEEIEDLEWSPDGTWLAFTSRRRDEAQYSPARDADRPARRLRQLGWRFDNIGWLADRPRALSVVRADGTTPARVLVAGPRDVNALCWSPDGGSIAFSQARHESFDLDGVIDLWTVAAGGGEPVKLTQSDLDWSTPVWSPQGLAAYRHPPYDVARHAELVVLDPTGAATPVAPGLDRGRPFGSLARPQWDGDRLLFLVEDHGNTTLLRSPQDVVLTGDRVITGFDRRAGRLAISVSTPTCPGEVLVIDDGDATERGIARFDVDFPTSAPERFTAAAPGGPDVEAWLIRPIGFDPARRYPVLVNIHGGPYTQYGYGFFDEFQVQARAGYAVLYSNPRGSAGYGEAWGRCIRGPRCRVDPGTGWGSVDADDVLAVVDVALTRWSFLDGAQVGVLGGSYGGYLTSWLIGHTDRFAAACSERSVNNVLSMTHTSDIGWYFNVEYSGVGPMDPGGVEELLRISPSAYAADIHTPLLIVHSEHDWRCPIEQAEDLFMRLRLLGRDVELVRFPGEGHELSRSGAPRHRRERFEILLEFFAKHLAPAQLT